MDPITNAVIRAITLGAANKRAGEEEIPSIAKAYKSLKKLLKKRLGKDSAVYKAVKKVEKQPDREGLKITLQEEVAESGADKDLRLVEAANTLINLIDSSGIGEMPKSITASGERSVAAGSISGSSVQTGDRVDTGGGAYFSGKVKAGRDVVGRDKIETTTTGASADELSAAFLKIHAALNKQPEGPEKTVAEQAVKAVEEEAKKGEEASEEKTDKWMTVLEKTLPDVAEVVVDALLSPGAAVGTVVRKVLGKTKESLKSGKAKG